jgi:hypothetical protein
MHGANIFRDIIRHVQQTVSAERAAGGHPAPTARLRVKGAFYEYETPEGRCRSADAKAARSGAIAGRCLTETWPIRQTSD